jgi:integrase
MKVVTKKFRSGERYIFLLDGDGIPDFWVTHFVTQKLRMNLAASSIRQYLKNIKHFKLWEKLNERDVLEEIFNGSVLNEDDINSIADHCSYHNKAFEQKQIGKVIDMGEFYLSKTKDKPTIGKSQYISRIAHIAEFLHFVGKERVKKKPTATELNVELNEMKDKLKSKMSEKKLRNVTSDKSGITNEALDDFRKISQPSSIHNPFKDPTIRLRNYLIVQTLFESGMRCAELLALRINDIGFDTENPSLKVVRRHDSKEDPRLIDPTAKTLARDLPISRSLRDSLNTYIKSHRSNTKVAKTHPFIFVSHKAKAGSFDSGQPLTSQTVTDIFNKFKKVNPELFWGITPHIYRHYFNDRLATSIDLEREIIKQEVRRLEASGRHQEAKLFVDENRITDKRAAEITAELNGHSSLESSKIYQKKTLKKQASKARQNMQKDLETKVEKNR